MSPESSSVQLKVAGYYDPSTGQPASTPYYGFIYLLDAQPYGNSASASNPNGQATGTITFKSGTSTIGASTLDSTGHAELQTTTISGGSSSLTAEFPGDASFQASTSAPVALTVTPAITSLNLSSSIPYSIVAGSAVTLSTTLSSNSAGAAPTGTVTFMNGSTPLGSASLSGTAAGRSTLASGSATITNSTLIVGSYTVTAGYSGDGNYASSTSGPVQFTILPMYLSLVVMPPSTTTPTNQPVTVTVNMIPVEANGLQAPTGTMTLTYKGITSSPVTVTNSSAAITIPANSLPVGNTMVTATYSGDQYYATASSSGYINMEGSGTIHPNIVVAAPGGTVNYPVSVVVSVSGASGDPIPTGNITLQGGYWWDTLPLTNGAATFVIQNSLLGGSNPLTATYLGDSNYTSGTGTGVVNVFANGLVYFPYANLTTVVNQPLDVTVAVANPGNNLPDATGTITLSSGSYTSSAVQLNAGTATITIPANSLDIGGDTVTATYSGDANYSPGSGAEIVSVTAVPNPSLSISGTNLTVSRGATSGNTSTITLTPSGGFTGTVNLTATIASSPAGASNLPTLSFGSTTPVTISDTNAKTATLTVNTKAQSSASLTQPSGPFAPWYGSGSAALACVILLGIPARRRRLRSFFAMILLLIALSAGVAACGGGGGNSSTPPQVIPGTTPGTYTITVTGTSGSTSSTSNVTLTVQ